MIERLKLIWFVTAGGRLCFGTRRLQDVSGVAQKQRLTTSTPWKASFSCCQLLHYSCIH